MKDRKEGEAKTNKTTVLDTSKQTKQEIKITQTLLWDGGIYSKIHIH